VFPEAGPSCRTIRDANAAGSGNPAYFVDITATIDAGIASLREHGARLDGLGRDFDSGEFLRNMAATSAWAPDASTLWACAATRWG
jgi:hypothetical protein